MKSQKDRVVSLTVAQKGGKALVIDNLHIDFRVSKSANNKDNSNKAIVKIYNLSEEKQRYFEKDFTEVRLDVGYAALGTFAIFAGQVTIAGTRKEGVHVVTELQIESLYNELNTQKLSRTAPPGTSVKGVIETCANVLGAVKSVYSGENINRSFIDGYPMIGSPRQILNQIAEAFELEWQLDQQILYIQDAGKSYMTDGSKAYVLNENSGLIDRPYFDNVEKRRGKEDKLKKARKGVKLKILLNPAIKAGSIVKIDFGEFTGYYKVERLTHSGGLYSEDWTTDLVCGTMIK